MLCVVFCGGCWDNVELQNLGIVLGIGLDFIPEAERVDNEQVLVTIEIANMRKSDPNSTGTASDIFQSSGETVIAAIRKLTNIVTSKLFWGHDQVLIISEDILKQGLNHYIDFFNRYTDIRPTIKLIAVEGRAADYFDTEGGMSIIFTYGTMGIYPVNSRLGFSSINAVSLQSYVEASCWGYAGLLLPWGHILEKDKQVPEKDGDGDNRTIERHNAINYLEGMVVLSPVGTFVAALSAEETIAAIMWRGELENFIISFSLSDTAKDEYLSFVIKNLKVRKKWGEENGQSCLNLTADFSAILAEGNYNQESKNTQTRKKIEEQLQTEIEKYLRSAWDKSLELEVDYILVGDHMRRYNNPHWRRVEANWPKAMPEILLKITVNGVLSSSGDAIEIISS